MYWAFFRSEKNPNPIVGWFSLLLFIIIVITIIYSMGICYEKADVSNDTHVGIPHTQQKER